MILTVARFFPFSPQRACFYLSMQLLQMVRSPATCFTIFRKNAVVYITGQLDTLEASTPSLGLELGKL